MSMAFLRLLPLLLLQLAAPGARADVLNGSYTIDFSGPQSQWPMESIDLCSQSVADGIIVEICIDFPIALNGAGRISGTGSITVDISGALTAHAVLNGPILGKSKGSDTKGVKQTIKYNLDGPIEILSVPFDMSVSGKFVTLISNSGVASTTGNIKVSIDGVGSSKALIEPPIVKQLPSGEWSAVLSVTPDAENTVLTGTVDLMLPDRTVQIPLSGKYSASKDESKLKARGDKENPSQKGISFSLKNVTSTGAGSLEADAKAKVQGLKVGGAVATP